MLPHIGGMVSTRPCGRATKQAVAAVKTYDADKGFSAGMSDRVAELKGTVAVMDDKVGVSAKAKEGAAAAEQKFRRGLVPSLWASNF